MSVCLVYCFYVFVFFAYVSSALANISHGFYALTSSEIVEDVFFWIFKEYVAKWASYFSEKVFEDKSGTVNFMAWSWIACNN